jgi:hypothetical protein
MRSPRSCGKGEVYELPRPPRPRFLPLDRGRLDRPRFVGVAVISNPFKLPSPLRLATQRLEEAQRELIEAEGALEMRKAQVAAYRERIVRLQKRVQELAQEPKENRNGT